MLLKWPEIGIELSRPMHSGLTTDASPNRGKQGHARCAGTTACSACGASARVVTTPYTYLSPTPIMGCGGVGPGIPVADLALIPRGFPDWVLSKAGSAK